MAVGLDTGVPWVMCKEDDAPDPVVSFLHLVSLSLLLFTLKLFLIWGQETFLTMEILSVALSKSWEQINTCNGFYCDAFSPNKPYKPTLWTEAWSGW